MYPEKGALNAIYHDGSAEGDIRDGYIDFGSVRISVDDEGNLNWAGNHSFAHEVGHASGLMGHAWTLSGDLTAMIIGSKPSPYIPRFIDRKLAWVVYEDSFQHGEGTGLIMYGNEVVWEDRLSSNDVLGLYLIREKKGVASGKINHPSAW